MQPEKIILLATLKPWDISFTDDSEDDRQERSNLLINSKLKTRRFGKFWRILTKMLRYEIIQHSDFPQSSKVIKLLRQEATSDHRDQLHPGPRFRDQGSSEIHAHSTPDDCHRQLMEQSVYLLCLAHL